MKMVYFKPDKLIGINDALFRGLQESNPPKFIQYGLDADRFHLNPDADWAYQDVADLVTSGLIHYIEP